MEAIALPASPKLPAAAGHVFRFVRDPLGYLTEAARRSGDIAPIAPPTGKAYLINGLDGIEEVLSSQHRCFAKPKLYNRFASLLGEGLIMSGGDFWLRQRRLAQPAFHRERIAAYGATIVEHTEQMLAGWSGGGRRPMLAEMLLLTQGIITKILFDASVGEDASGMVDAIDVLIEELGGRVTNPLQIPERIPTPGNVRYRRAVRKVDAVIYRMIEERRSSGRDAGDLLSMLLRMEEEDGTRMTDQQLRDEAMTMFFAGHETSAVAMAWAWFLLASHPDVEARLLEELRDTLGGRAPTVADLPRLQFTEMVVKESLRLYPPGWLFARHAIRDCEIGGRRVPAGTEIWLSPWVTHRDPRYFEAADEFRPLRWSADAARPIPKYAYFPFGHGPRQCIGNALASMEMTLVIATVAQRFSVKLDPLQHVVPQPLLTLRPKNGLSVIVSRRPEAAPVDRS